MGYTFRPMSCILLALYIILTAISAAPGVENYRTTTSTKKTTSSSSTFKTTSSSTKTTSTSTSKTSSTSSVCPTYMSYSFNLNNTFDNVPNANQLAATTDIQLYNLLFWNLVEDSVSPNGVTAAGVAAQSPPDIARFSGDDTLLFGTPYISSVYLDSQVKYFTLKSLYYGCVLADNTVATVPVSCNITATGFAANGVQVASQTFTFIANGATVQPMNFGVLSSAFQNMVNVTLDVTNPLTTAAHLDNVQTQVFQ